MPYIKLRDRQALNYLIDELLDSIEANSELNYCLTRLLTESPVTRQYTGYNYIVVVLGTIRAIEHEFTRRVAGPYEQKKERENGDVLGYEIGVPSGPSKH